MVPAALAAKRATEVAKIPFDTEAYRCIASVEELDAVLARARETGILALDTETDSLDANRAELVGLSLALAPGDACYVPVGHRGEDNLFGGGLAPGQLPAGDVIARLKPVLEDRSVLKVGHDIKSDWVVLKRHGIDVAPVDDTLLISYVLDAGRYGLAGHAMTELADRHLGHTTIDLKAVAGTGKAAVGFDRVPVDKATAYAAEKADVTLRLWLLLKPRLTAERRAKVYDSLERPLVDVIARMEMRGIAVDRQILSRLSGDFAQTLARLEAEIQEIAGEKFSPGSPKQIGDVLFGKMGLPGARKTATGQWATGANVLEDLAAEGHALPKLLLEWRQLAKLKSTYTDSLQTYMHPQTGRVHTCYSLAATTTGRLSSSEPNLQNIPIRTEPGRKIRAAFVAEPGNKIISADYSQIELQGPRPHRRHPAAPSGLRRRHRHPRRDRLDDVRRASDRDDAGPAPQRQDDQFRHHLRHVGVRARRAARHRPLRGRRLHQAVLRALPRHPRLHRGDEARLPRARLCHDAVRARLPLSGHRDLEPLAARRGRAPGDQRADPGLGRRHHPPRHDPHGRRARRAEADSARMLLQVHDELVFEAPDEEVEATLPVIRKVMAEAPLPAVKLSVPLGVDARAAGNWDEAH